ncbi:nuclease-related domain-containing protein [Pontibacillus litoralis]|uniref:NERD domain-containing protein n=1 Tax=Pontibacillus litoralis JSM 072002 TaxID=1385512 RepID=A0A0A5HRT1_9BACI|nr:nuclease-related domain-containing protein [Pontibacillus litoralis]KGX86342.1 hypothetical protein N784_05170 [Pontibacillus litoralis JSM 072002]
MIIKSNDKPPLYLQQLEALMRRVSSQHPSYQKISDRYRNFSAGYAGERALNYPLSLLRFSPHFVFFDLRLQNANLSFFQMDCVVITPYVAIIIESKNVAGDVYFDHRFRQMIRKDQDGTMAMPDPIEQVEGQRLQLLEWLDQRGYPRVPVEKLVVMTNRNAVLRSSDSHEDALKYVVRLDFLTSKLEQILVPYIERILPKKESTQLCDDFLAQHKEYFPSILPPFHLTQDDIVKGVICVACGAVPMARCYGKWQCPACQATSKKAHLSALKDYALLIRSWIFNYEAQQFLQIDSRHTVKRLMQGAHLSMDRPYVLRETINFSI